jgi:predicted nucleic acid-binding protein
MAGAGQLARPGICDLEIGYAARNADEWDRLIGALDAFEAVETGAAHVARALQVQRLLAARSQQGRKVPDLRVAAAAEALNLAVLRYDADFEHISKVTGRAHEWSYPPAPWTDRSWLETRAYATPRSHDVPERPHPSATGSLRVKRATHPMSQLRQRCVRPTTALAGSSEHRHQASSR